MSTTYLEFLDANLFKNYPLDDTKEILSTTGVPLPKDFITDMRLYAYDYTATTLDNSYYISAILVTSTTITIEISDYATNNLIASAVITNFDIISTSELSARTVNIYATNNSNIYGVLILGNLDSIRKLGSLYFTKDMSTIHPSCIVLVKSIDYFKDYGKTYKDVGIKLRDKLIEAIGTKIADTISIYNEDTSIIDQYSDLNIVAGDGIRFIVDSANNSITIVREPIKSEATIQSIDEIIAAIKTVIGNYVTSINGVLPDSNGNINIKGLDCTEITAIEHGLTISDSCSKPCCTFTSEDSSKLENGLAQLREASTRLTAFYDQLSKLLPSMEAKLATLIADRR